MTSVLSCERICKSYPGVKSLDDVGIEIAAGSIHALVGENGAGKSTLVGVLSGAVQPDSGTVHMDGVPKEMNSARVAREAGIHVVHQELILFPDMTVAENIFLGEEPRTRLGMVDARQMRRHSAAILSDLGTHIDVNQKVRDLTVADQQMVEIARALIGKVKVLFLDEPTAVISGQEVDLLFDRLAQLRKQGVAIVYISHRLDEIFEIADEVTVLKDGQFVGHKGIADVTHDGLVSMMVGREISDLYPAKQSNTADRIVLKIDGLSDRRMVKSVDLQLNAGEILGIAGMVGSGRSELAEMIFGLGKPAAGSIEINGHPFDPTPAKSISEGVGFLTEDRKRQGLMLNLSVAANISAPRLKSLSSSNVINLRAETALATSEIDALSIAGAQPATRVGNLSGGNQQKVLIARWRHISEKILILDEPTRGVDIGAKSEIYRLIRECAQNGVSILLISSEMQEIVGMSDRVIVMREGQVSGELQGDDIAEEAIVHLATSTGA
ncbi:sugar ABC transporter ATP-binding protein [Ruegeria lacuscaerulensis]|uniref:sugar ABC transporter ATP-binding protein n=1 Tax=Ruegeria lacuscaerulensis TaxID=55218 RepID=UPI00147C270E|nr:sugar ABC transporter ATP-binding protein [Ruegeria lacuscaerulensis]